MKLNFGKKLVLFFHWLFALIISAIAVMYYVVPELVNKVNEKLVQSVGRNETTVLLVILMAIYVALAVAVVLMIFRNKEKRDERGYIIIDNGEKGRSRIAISAIDQMVRQSIRNVDGVSEMRTMIVGMQDSITIKANVTVQNGAHIPTVTANVQNSIRSYIELNCGVAVREVLVSVNAMDLNSNAPEQVQQKTFFGTAKKAAGAARNETPVVEKAVEAVEEIAEASVEEKDEYYIPGEGEEIKLTLGVDKE